MKIKNVQIIETEIHKIISAKCTVRKFGSDEIYSKIDKQYGEFLFADTSSFAAALLFPSMKQEEDLIIKGKISKQLYYCMHQIMNTVTKWNIGLQPIKIIAYEIIPDKENPSITLSFFSEASSLKQKLVIFIIYLDHVYTFGIFRKKALYLLRKNGYQLKNLLN